MSRNNVDGLKFRIICFSLFFTVLQLGFVNLAQAAEAKHFACKVQLNKAPCWKDFRLEFQMINSADLKPLKSYIVDKGVESKTVSFDCSELQSYTFTAKYTPVIWDNRKGVVYHAKTIWHVPSELAAGENAWLSQLCFAGDFLGVPLPLKDIDKCACTQPKVTTPSK